jgi:Co/Zn/Cd efflux system component
MSTKTSSNNTYGWARAGVLGPFTNSVFLVSLCFGITIEAIERLIERRNIDNVRYLLITGCVGLAINLLGLVLLKHDHSHNNQSHLDTNNQMKNRNEESNNLEQVTVVNKINKDYKATKSEDKTNEESVLVAQPQVKISNDQVQNTIKGALSSFK